MDRCELTGIGARSSSVSPGTQSNARGWQDVLLHLPVGVNCQSGDPFQPNQELQHTGQTQGPGGYPGTGEPWR